MSDPDPGFKNPDGSLGFNQLLANLDYFQGTNYVRAARRAMHRALAPQPGMRLLDAGCGTGLDVAALAKRIGKEGWVVGLDVSSRLLDVARERYGRTPNACFVAGSIDALAFADGSFDGACSMRTVQYLEDPMTGLRELARVTKPGGRVVVVEGGMATVDLPDSEITRMAFGHGSDPGMGTRLPVLMRQAGLTDVGVKPGFGFDLGAPDPEVLNYVRSLVADVAAEGIVGRNEAKRWLAELESMAVEGRWFSADCMFVVVGTVPESAKRR